MRLDSVLEEKIELDRGLQARLLIRCLLRSGYAPHVFTDWVRPNGPTRNRIYEHARRSPSRREMYTFKCHKSAALSLAYRRFCLIQALIPHDRMGHTPSTQLL